MGWIFALIVVLIPTVAAVETTGPALVIAGDTLVVDETTINLAAIDAPEFDQTCERDGVAWPCGEAAVEALRGVVGDRPVACRILERKGESSAIGTCTVGDEDLALAVVTLGFALGEPAAGADIRAAEAAARQAGLGIWSSEFIEPARWRKINDCSCAARRKAFMRLHESATVTQPNP